MSAYLLQFKYCVGCGNTSEKCKVLVALPGSIFVCEDCVALMATIVAKESPKMARISFVEYMLEMLREPAEVVSSWKAADAMRESAATDSSDALTEE